MDEIECELESKKPLPPTQLLVLSILVWRVELSVCSRLFNAQFDCPFHLCFKNTFLTSILIAFYAKKKTFFFLLLPNVFVYYTKFNNYTIWICLVDVDFKLFFLLTRSYYDLRLMYCVSRNYMR